MCPVAHEGRAKAAKDNVDGDTNWKKHTRGIDIHAGEGVHGRSAADWNDWSELTVIHKGRTTHAVETR